jgi:hypothetical protein
MIETRTLEAPGAVLHYDIRPGGTDAEPPLLLIGSPMGAPGFTTLAGHFTDRTVVTYDPRGAERSERTDGATETAVEEHAEDLRRVIEAVGSPKSAGSGASRSAVSFVKGPWWDISAMNFAMAGPRPDSR